MTVLEAAPLDERSDIVDFSKQNTKTPQLAREKSNIVEIHEKVAEYVTAKVIKRTPHRRF